MTALPSVEPLPPGTRPTEPGWYVSVFEDDIKKEVVEVVEFEEELCVWVTWDVEFYSLSDFAFIARIYPDRIGQE